MADAVKEQSNTNKGQLACTYASLILHDANIKITSDKINELIKAANVEIEPYWVMLFAKYLEGKDVGSLLRDVGGSSQAGPAAATEDAPVEEEKKEEEEEEESEEDMLGALF